MYILKGISMKYITFFLLLTACAAIASDFDSREFAVGEKNSSEEKNTEISAEKIYQTPALAPANDPYDSLNPAGAPIPTLMLPNNVCIINTDLSPNRTIEEHIAACIVSHRARQRLTP